MNQKYRNSEFNVGFDKTKAKPSLHKLGIQEYTMYNAYTEILYKVINLLIKN